MVSFTLSDPLFAGYCFYAAVLALKMLVMSPLTARFRLSKGIFSNPEDTKLHPKGHVTLADPDVERVRRAHRNDLENIPVFLFMAPLYLMTSPSHAVALIMFRVFTLARILHTVVYLCQVRQPARGLCFFVGMVVNVFMCVQVIRATL